MGRCELGCEIAFPSPSYDSRSVLAVKGLLRRAKRAPLTAPGRSEAHNLYEGKGIRGTSHLSTISASAPQSAFHRSTGSRLLHPADPTSPAVTSEPKRRPRNSQIPYTPVRSWATRKGDKALINRELSLLVWPLDDSCGSAFHSLRETVRLPASSQPCCTDRDGNGIPPFPKR